MNEQQLETLIALLLKMDERLNLLESENDSPVILTPWIVKFAKDLELDYVKCRSALELQDVEGSTQTT